MKTIVVDSNQQLLDLYPTLMTRDQLAIDTETTGLDWTQDKVAGVSVSWDGETGYYIPFHHASGKQCNPLVAQWVMEGVIRNPHITKLFHNSKFDIHLMWSTFGVRTISPMHDTIIMAFLTDNTVPKNLKDWSARVFSPELKELERQLKWEVKARHAPSYAHLPVDVISEYAVGDAVYTFKLFEHFKDRVLKMPLYSTEIRLVDVVIDMERAGVLINQEMLIEGGRKLEIEQPKIEAKLCELAGWPVNPRSPQQVAKLLYEQLEMPILKRTKTGKPSSGEEILLNLPPHPIIDAILRARAVSKCKSTYVDGILGKLDSQGRLHCRFNQLGAETGRFSSSKPNLQNIPREGSMPISIRQAFIPSPGHVLVFIDYKQVEMRLFAHYSNDPGLLEAARSGYDFHRMTAAEIAHIESELVTKEARKFAKSVNFGVIYGIGVRTLARRLKITQREAQAFLDRYFAQFPGIRPFMNECKSQFELRGYVENMFGRRRFIPFDKAYRSVNTLIQGTAADVIKTKMVELRDLLNTTEIKLLMQVHDELIFDVPIEWLHVIPRIVEIMEDFRLRVPIQVDVEWSDQSWGHKKPWTSPEEVARCCTAH